MKKYQKLLIFTLFFYTLFSINWYRNYNETSIKFKSQTRELNVEESIALFDYNSNRTYFKEHSETFKYYKSALPGLMLRKSFNDGKVKYSSKLK